MFQPQSRFRAVLACLGAGLAMLSPDIALAGVQDARSMSLGGARQAVTDSASTAWAAPALLGMDSSHGVLVSFPVAVSVGAGNDFLGFKGIDSLLGGQTLTDADISSLLSSVSSSGLGLNLHAGLSTAIALPSLRSGLFLRGHADTYGIAIPRDLIALFLGGNDVVPSLRVDTLQGARAEAYADAGLSVALPLPLSLFRNASLGITGRYLRGLWMGRVSEARGSVLSLAEDGTVSGDARARWQVAGNGGSGWALDTQLAFDLRDDLRVTTHVSNLGAMTWSRIQDRLQAVQIPETQPFSFENGQFTNNLGELQDFKRFTSESAQGLDGQDLTEILPLVFGAGLAWQAPIRWMPLSVYADAEVGQGRGFGASPLPRLRTGLELKPFSFLPIRVGYGAGGEQPSWFSAGFGIDVPFWRLDAAVVAQDGLFGSAKGAMYALSSQLQF